MGSGIAAYRKHVLFQIMKKNKNDSNENNDGHGVEDENFFLL